MESGGGHRARPPVGKARELSGSPPPLPGSPRSGDEAGPLIVIPGGSHGDGGAGRVRGALIIGDGEGDRVDPHRFLGRP